MNDQLPDDALPRRDLPVLPPHPESFSIVTRRARARRAQTAGATALASLVLVGAAITGVSALTGEGQRDALLADAPTATASPSSEPSPPVAETSAPTPTPAPAPTPTAAASPSPAPVTAPPSEEVEEDPSTTGTVVDRRGRPVAGLYVYAFTSGDRTPSEPVDRTDAEGRYTVICNAIKVLLVPWRLGARQPADMPNVALTWVGGGRSYGEAPENRCEDVRTVVAEGGTLTGRIGYVDDEGQEHPYHDHAVPGGGLYCTVLGIDELSAQCASWDPVGGRYTFRGLATGSYRLQGMHGGDGVSVVEGSTTERDWVECAKCRDGRRPPATPTASPSPAD